MTSEVRSAMRPQCEPDATDGRTDERRSRIADGNHLAVVDAGGISSIRDIIEQGILPSGERHTVVRAGERDEIPDHVRSAVFHRDRGRCELCGWQRVEGPWHLDHIVPWSAGGSDRSDNLRVLCEMHNLGRSNYVDPTERPRRPVTWWCVNCHTEPPPQAFNYDTQRLEVVCRIHRGSTWCRINRARAWCAENDVADWWTREVIDQTRTLVVAFCAHCNAPGLTDQPL